MAKNNQQPTQGEQVATTVSSVEAFFKKNEKVIEWAIIAIIVVVCGILAYNRWYLTPAKAEAQGQMFPAEQKFMAGEFETALNGDGNILGFTQIAEQYGNKAGKSVWLYSGICNLNLGNNEAAIECLKKYKSSDKVMMGRALCCIGDAYANLDNKAEALNYFKKAAAVEDNLYAAAYLLKAGIISEEMGNNAEALKFYQQIKDNYPQSMEGYDIDKYISRINAAE
ncbi:MAG: tetratricopeptide repeat protein [Bacteroidales bacterium]|nr:tetratricopeptide repeat protein [Candidatus Cacconaster merdequi]